MKLLLAAVNAKYIHSNLAVYSLKASAGKYEPLLELAEYTVNNRTEDIFRSVFLKKPDVLFLSCYIWNRREILEISENLRRVRPETVIWAGGPEVSYDAEQFLQENPQFDGVMCGEGEQSFFHLLQFYVDKIGSLEEIPGIVYRSEKGAGALQSDGGAEDTGAPGDDGEYGNDEEYGNAGARRLGGGRGEIRSTGPAKLLKNLDSLPFVYRNTKEFQNRIIYYESSRGCPFSCSYCLSSIDKRVRFRSLELVRNELAFFLEQRVPQVKFVDRTFNCNHAHAMEIWRFILEHDNGVTNFHFEIAADILTEEELELLSRMRPGLVQLEIGVQTVNGRALEAIHRMAGFEQIADRVNRISRRKNIHQHLDLIAGLPYEDYESFKTSFDRVYSLKPQELQLGFLKVLRGSEMHRRAEEYGILYRSSPPYEVLSTRWISCDELMRLKAVEEMLEVYYNSQQFRCTMEALETYFERPFAMYESLADYYEAQGFGSRAWSRMQRFEMLRDFIRQMPGSGRDSADDGAPAKIRREGQAHGLYGGSEGNAGRMQIFDELLTLDFYLRENGKSRPSWAEEQSPYREKIGEFYRREAQEHRYLPGCRDMTWKQAMRMTHLERFTFITYQADEPGRTGEAAICSGGADICPAGPETGGADIGPAGPEMGGADIGPDGAGAEGCREYWLLFDYGRRDPLTGDALVQRVDI